MNPLPQPIAAVTLPEVLGQTNYPAPFAAQVQGRAKRKLGDHYGLQNLGVNLTRLLPGAVSALLHSHARQDEFIYILAGHPTLIVRDRAYELSPGDCMGFPAGGEAHQLVNRTEETVTYLEMGDRAPHDEVTYPQDDLRATMNAQGEWEFRHQDGSLY